MWNHVKNVWNVLFFGLSCSLVFSPPTIYYFGGMEAVTFIPVICVAFLVHLFLYVFNKIDHKPYTFNNIFTVFTIWTNSYVVPTFIRFAVTERYTGTSFNPEDEQEEVERLLRNEVGGTVKKAHFDYDLFINALYNMAPLCFLALCEPEDLTDTFNRVSFAILYFQLNWVLQSTIHDRHSESLDKKLENWHICYKTKRMIARFHILYTISKTLNVIFVVAVMAVLAAYTSGADCPMPTNESFISDARFRHTQLIILAYVNNALFSVYISLRSLGGWKARCCQTKLAVWAVSFFFFPLKYHCKNSKQEESPFKCFYNLFVVEFKENSKRTFFAKIGSNPEIEFRDAVINDSYGQFCNKFKSEIQQARKELLDEKICHDHGSGCFQDQVSKEFLNNIRGQHPRANQPPTTKTLRFQQKLTLNDSIVQLKVWDTNNNN